MPKSTIHPRKALAYTQTTLRYPLVILYMADQMQVAKWGNSLAVRLPLAVIDEPGLKEGDDIQITAEGKDRMEVEKNRGVEEMLEPLNRFSGCVPLDFQFDRQEANTR